jgi:excisionase family DNA binding protein
LILYATGTYRRFTAKQANRTIVAFRSKGKKVATRINDIKSSKKLKIESQTSVTVKGISNYCLVSECTVRRWIKDGKISVMRLPSGQYRITAADFKDFLSRYGMLTKEL